MTSDEARDRARAWIDSWNSHDLDRILSHYTDDFTMSSPYIAKVMDEPTGTLHGKDRVRAYWAKGLALAPHLQFRLLDAFAGVASLAIRYDTTLTGKTVVEVLTLAPDGRFTRGHAHNEA